MRGRNKRGQIATWIHKTGVGAFTFWNGSGRIQDKRWKSVRNGESSAKSHIFSWLKYLTCNLLIEIMNEVILMEEPQDE